MKIGPAHGASLDAQPHLAGPWDRIGPLLQSQRLADAMQYHRLHVAILPAAAMRQFPTLPLAATIFRNRLEADLAVFSATVSA
jgi:hypothetical protein